MILDNPEIVALLASAAGIAFTHTLMGPDHYLPFVSIAIARRWSWWKLLSVTLACGAGHLVGSVLLGLMGIWAQAELSGLVAVETVRGNLAAWLLFSAGLLYLAWGIRHAGRHHVHRHSHAHPQWLIFIVFVLGPCEPLIPLLMYPAAKASAMGVIAVTLVFGAVTVLTMLLTVSLSYLSLRQLHFPRIERYGHAMAGATLSACGASMLFLGL
jgi:hypothetical protein